MSVDLIDLLPALYRIRDAQAADSQQLLTVEETAELGSLRALTPPLTSDQQARLDELSAKAARGPLESLLMLIGEQIADLLADQHQQRLQRATRGLGGELIELRPLVSGKRRGQSLQRGQLGEFRGGQQRL